MSQWQIASKRFDSHAGQGGQQNLQRARESFCSSFRKRCRQEMWMCWYWPRRATWHALGRRKFWRIWKVPYMCLKCAFCFPLCLWSLHFSCWNASTSSSDMSCFSALDFVWFTVALTFAYPFAWLCGQGSWLWRFPALASPASLALAWACRAMAGCLLRKMLAFATLKWVSERAIGFWRDRARTGTLAGLPTAISKSGRRIWLSSWEVHWTNGHL